MPDLRELVARVEAEPEVEGDWGQVVRDAGLRRRRVVLPAVAAAVVIAMAGLALFQPWSREEPAFLERALAAVDGGPVLHVVLRGEWGGQAVELATGERRPVHGETEVWYDPDRRLIRTVSRLGETVQSDETYEVGEGNAQIVALGRDYRKALQSGSARIAGQDVIDGRAVTWVVVRSQMLPDSDGRAHEWAQQVAVSNETYEPVALRDTRDGRPPPGGIARILDLEMLPAGEGELMPGEDSVREGPFQFGNRPIPLERAGDVLGQTPLWLGPEHQGLSLARVSETFLKRGRHTRTKLTGLEAEQISECMQQRGRKRWSVPPCSHLREHRGGLEIRGDTVYGLGPTEWIDERKGVMLFYGETGDDPSTYHRDVIPLVDKPHVSVTQSTTLPTQMTGGSYLPPDGWVFIAVGGRNGLLKIGHIYIALEASSPELLLSAARALKAMP
jgi:hypothetical protein